MKTREEVLKEIDTKYAADPMYARLKCDKVPSDLDSSLVEEYKDTVTGLNCTIAKLCSLSVIDRQGWQKKQAEITVFDSVVYMLCTEVFHDVTTHSAEDYRVSLTTIINTGIADDKFNVVLAVNTADGLKKCEDTLFVLNGYDLKDIGSTAKSNTEAGGSSEHRKLFLEWEKVVKAGTADKIEDAVKSAMNITEEVSSEHEETYYHVCISVLLCVWLCELVNKSGVFSSFTKQVLQNKYKEFKVYEIVVEATNIYMAQSGVKISDCLAYTIVLVQAGNADKWTNKPQLNQTIQEQVAIYKSIIGVGDEHE